MSEQWIEELLTKVRHAEWGTKDLIDAVWDLCDVTDSGLLKAGVVDAAVNDRLAMELTKGQRTKQRPIGWRRAPGIEAWEDAA